MKRITKVEEPDDNKREALNCFNAPQKCHSNLNGTCKEQNYEVWKVCPINKELN